MYFPGGRGRLGVFSSTSPALSQQAEVTSKAIFAVQVNHINLRRLQRRRTHTGSCVHSRHHQHNPSLFSAGPVPAFRGWHVAHAVTRFHGVHTWTDRHIRTAVSTNRSDLLECCGANGQLIRHANTAVHEKNLQSEEEHKFGRI